MKFGNDSRFPFYVRTPQPCTLNPRPEGSAIKWLKPPNRIATSMKPGLVPVLLGLRPRILSLRFGAEGFGVWSLSPRFGN